MSHLDEMKTSMTNKEALITAICMVMGLTRDQIEVHDKAQAIIGYHNTEDNKVGHIIVRKQHTKIPSDIGWEFKDGTYVGHLDAFDYGSYRGRPVYDRKWSIGLIQRYNIETTKMTFASKGLVAREVKDAKGRIQLRAFAAKAKAEPLRVHI